jgi:hypothetical protein
MTLEKSSSKKSFEHNVKTEIKSGAPVKKAVAISYGEKKQAQKAGDSKPVAKKK